MNCSLYLRGCDCGPDELRSCLQADAKSGSREPLPKPKTPKNLKTEFSIINGASKS